MENWAPSSRLIIPSMGMDAFLNSNIKQMTASETFEALKSDDVRLLDVRQADEMKQASIPGSIKLCIADLNEENLAAAGLGDERKHRHIIVHCHSGGRSQRACKAMKKWGYEMVVNLDGGIVDWRNMGYVIESGKASSLSDAIDD